MIGWRPCKPYKLFNLLSIKISNFKMNNLQKQKNKFEQMGFIKFWLFSSIFLITFAISLIVSIIFLGPYQTKEFILVLIKDYIQTLLIIFISLIVIMYFLYNFIISFFS